MSYATPRLHRVAVRLLTHEAGGDEASAERLAAASVRLLARLRQRLAEVIGHVGVQALLLRAVKLSKSELPALDEELLRPGSDDVSEVLRARLQGQDPQVVREATARLFATIVGLLVTIIGHRLAWNLLRDAWPATLEEAEE